MKEHEKILKTLAKNTNEPYSEVLQRFNEIYKYEKHFNKIIVILHKFYMKKHEEKTLKNDENTIDKYM